MAEPDAAAFLDRWHRIVQARDLEALGDVLSPDVSIGAPPYWERFPGHALCQHLLGLILETVEDFTSVIAGYGRIVVPMSSAGSPATYPDRSPHAANRRVPSTV